MRTGQSRASAGSRESWPAVPSSAPKQVVDALEPVFEPRQRRRWPLAAAVFVLLAAVGGYALFSLRPRPPQFETVRAERGRITARVTATGTLSAVTTVQVGTQVSGRVNQLFVDFNTPVKKGQLLATLDPQLLQAAVDQAQASFVAARGTLTKAGVEAAHANRELRRSRALWRDNLIARADLEAAQANAGAARGQLAAAQGTLAQAAANQRQARVNLGYTKILSPIDGVVISRNVDVGQTVAASLQAPTLFTIAEDPRKMQVDTNVAEADVGKLRPGMKATFKVDAFPGEKFRGRVRQIRDAAQVLQNVVTYDAVIDVDNSDLRLKPGMTANVAFVVAEKADALKIPTAALRFRPPAALAPAQPKPLLGEGERLVWTVRKGELWPVRVRTGLSEGATTEVVEGGLSPSDALVIDVAGANGMPEGTRAKKEKEKDKEPKLKVF